MNKMLVLSIRSIKVKGTTADQFRQESSSVLFFCITETLFFFFDSSDLESGIERESNLL